MPESFYSTPFLKFTMIICALMALFMVGMLIDTFDLYVLGLLGFCLAYIYGVARVLQIRRREEATKEQQQTGAEPGAWSEE